MISEYKVKKYCCEDIKNIENYNKAANSPEMWECHHKLELIATGGVCDVDRQDLKDWNIYYNRPADELIFLTRTEHRKLHYTGKLKTEETRRKMSEAKKGKKRGTYGAKGKHWKLVNGKRIYY